jgi:hypothetical protein
VGQVAPVTGATSSLCAFEDLHRAAEATPDLLRFLS